MMNQADDALLRAASKTTGEKVVGFIEEEILEVEPQLSDEQLRDAVNCIVQGDFYQLSDSVLQPLMEKLTPFIEYVNNQTSNVKGSDS